MYYLEIGENQSPSICHCCSRKSNIGHGFICKNGDAYAVYYAGWTPDHLTKKISFAIAIGEWDDKSTISDRTCFGLEVSEGEGEILFRIIDPDESPWPITDLLGKMVSRKESLNHSLKNEVLLIAEHVMRNHDAIHEYLGMEK